MTKIILFINDTFIFEELVVVLLDLPHNVGLIFDC